MKILALPIALAALCVNTSIGHARVLIANTPFQSFDFYGVGSSFDDNFTFTLKDIGILTVTDAYNSGDQFEITNFGNSIGITSNPIIGHYVNNDYNAALADPYFSKATFFLGAGTYDISGTAIQSPFGGGGAFIGLTVSSVPLPASAPMFGAAVLALGVVGCGMKRKKAAAA